MTDPFTLFSAALLLFIGGALTAPLLQSKGPLAHAIGACASMAGSLLGLIAAGACLVTPVALDHQFTWTYGGALLVLHLDGLAAFFLLPLFLLIFCAALYAFRYLHPGSRRGMHWFFANLLAAAMALVVSAANGLFFLLAWEGMSLACFFLVAHEHGSDEGRRAGWLYLMATHLGVACLLFFFLMAGQAAGTLDFIGLGKLRDLPPSTAIALFGLLLTGFGAKAGLFPMHVWLPDAHPAAPSHISALMSGVMVKTAVYGFLRFSAFLPELPAWCGWTVTAAGAGGAVYGIALACMQTDIKRALAYSTVENIGIIFLGIGLWMTSAPGGPGAVLALTAALLHVWNHALFKGMLFLSAGALVQATGTRTVSRMGGLLKRMPITGSLFLLGGFAASALPPANALIGEWFLYLGLLEYVQGTARGSAFGLMLLVTFVGLVGGLAILTFTRIVGLALLGEATTPEAEKAEESPWPMFAGMALPAFFCLLLGIAPAAALGGAATPVRQLSGLSAADWEGVRQALPLNLAWSGTAGMLLILLAGLTLKRWRSGPSDRSATWGCGYLWPNNRMAYRAGGFSQLLRETVLSPGRAAARTPGTIRGLFPAPSSYRAEAPRDPVLDRGFAPLFRAIARQAGRLHGLQAGFLPMYLASICITTTLLVGLAMLCP